MPCPAMASDLENGFQIVNELFLRCPRRDRCKKYKELSLERTTSQRVLGVHWDIVVDEFRIKVDMPRKPCTRRGILSASHSLFDPLGFVAPVLVEIKLLLREMNGDDWDAALSEKKEERWRAWILALYYLEELKVPRCFKPFDTNGELTYELHHFSDASGEAYGAVSYLRIADKSGKVHCSFLMGKSHLAPAPMTTIPRLELLAAIVSLRLDQMLKKELSLVIEKTYFWSDSTSVLLSIYNSNKRFPVFVANRLAEIERNSDIQSWRYVPSKLNPEDEATRCKQAQAFVESSMWLSGPEFLQQAEEEWPEQLESLEQLPEEFPLFEKGMQIVSNLVVQSTIETPTDRLIEQIKRPLTPNDVLQLFPASGMPPTDTENSDSLIVRKWRHAQHFANLFWRQWAQEYLPTIKYRQKWYETKRNVMVNDIVILIDKNTPRSRWPLGRILKTFPDPKGFVRSAIVKMHGSEVKRPVSKMCVIVPATSKNDIPFWISTRLKI